MRDTHRGDKVPAEGFFDKGVDVGEVLTVSVGGDLVWSKDAIDLLLSFALDVLVESHGEEEAWYS